MGGNKNRNEEKKEDEKPQKPPAKNAGAEQPYNFMEAVIARHEAASYRIHSRRNEK